MRLIAVIGGAGSAHNFCLHYVALVYNTRETPSCGACTSSIKLLKISFYLNLMLE